MKDPTTLQDLTVADCLEQEWRLLQAFEHGETGLRWLSWESPGPAVVVGRHTVIADQVLLAACDEDAVPVLRRRSGGGAVVLGTGCLNFAIAASLESHPSLADVPSSFNVILGRIAAALQVPGLEVAGGSDLALDSRKVSGNAQRRGRHALLHHGTLLYGFDSTLATRYLEEPRRRPAYRAARTHADFLGNLPLAREECQARLAAALLELSRCRV